MGGVCASHSSPTAQDTVCRERTGFQTLKTPWDTSRELVFHWLSKVHRRKERKVWKQPSNICFSSRFQSINLVSLIGSIQWCVTSSQSDNRGATSLAGRRCFLWSGWGKTESNMGRGLSTAGSPARQRYTQKMAIGSNHRGPTGT